MKGIEIEVIRKTDLDGGNVRIALEIRRTKAPGLLESIDMSKDEVGALRDALNKALGLDGMVASFGITLDEAQKILDFQMTSRQCDSCSLYLKACYDCVFVHTDPVENYLFRTLTELGKTKGEIAEIIRELSPRIRDDHENSDECQYSYAYWRKYPCASKYRRCYECVAVCESPIERRLFMALDAKYPGVQPQVRVNKDGGLHSYTEPVQSSEILTVPDLYVEVEGKRLCIYADGHDFHERTPQQAKRDRSIDRELQRLGYTVLRFTGSEINSDIRKVLDGVVQIVGGHGV